MTHFNPNYKIRISTHRSTGVVKGLVKGNQMCVKSVSCFGADDKKESHLFDKRERMRGHVHAEDRDKATSAMRS